MQTRLNTDCRFNPSFAMLFLIGSLLLCLSGCLSYQYERRVEGIEVKDPGAAYPLETTTIKDVLLSLGAPDEVLSLDNTDLLIYRRSLLQESGLSLGVPLFEVAVGMSAELSARGALARHDTLIFWFSPQGELLNVVFDKASDRSYLRTLFSR